MKFTTVYDLDLEVGPLTIRGEIEIEIDAAGAEDYEWDFADTKWDGDNPAVEPQKQLFPGQVLRDETFMTALRAHLDRSDHFHDFLKEEVEDELGG